MAASLAKARSSSCSGERIPAFTRYAAFAVITLVLPEPGTRKDQGGILIDDDRETLFRCQRLGFHRIEETCPIFQLSADEAFDCGGTGGDRILGKADDRSDTAHGFAAHHLGAQFPKHLPGQSIGLRSERVDEMCRGVGLWGAQTFQPRKQCFDERLVLAQRIPVVGGPGVDDRRRKGLRGRVSQCRDAKLIPVAQG